MARISHRVAGEKCRLALGFLERSLQPGPIQRQSRLVKHDFQGDAFQDIADTGQLGAAFTLRGGKGAKGNTAWPGPFGPYYQLTP